MMTFSGAMCVPGSGVPSLSDIALGLGRMPRFGGQTTRAWSVLLHSLVCSEIALETNMSERVQLYALMHDAHEAVTADVPTPWKPDTLGMWQSNLDVRLYDSLGIGQPTPTEKSFVTYIDAWALRAEATAYGPPTIMQHLPEASPDDVAIVERIGDLFPLPQDTDGARSPGALEFYAVFARLLETPGRCETCSGSLPLARR